MQIFKTKWFARFARSELIADASLREAIARAKRGLIDADLGGGLIKQRVARQGKGRSGGYRVIVAYRATGRAVFLSDSPRTKRKTSARMSWYFCGNSRKTGLPPAPRRFEKKLRPAI